MISTLLSALSLLSVVVAQTQGTFNVLSYNVAGLPETLSSGNPEINTPLLSARLGPYNIIHVQEDFNYHATLYASDNHAYRTPTSGGIPLGSGLNTLSDYPYVDFSRTKWNSCNLNSGDCLTPKGFTFMRVRISDGVWVDFYNLHTDAGSNSGDITARSSNFAQLTSYIAQWSQGMPVVVMGDTNTRYTRAGDSETLRSFLSNTGTADMWVSKIRLGVFPVSGSDALVCDFPFVAGTTQAQQVACEVVDKIFVRGSPYLSFTSTSFINEHSAFVDSDGAPLSDHYPISSKLGWKLSSSIRLADPVGGPHGDAFNDGATTLASSIPKITTITIRGGNRVDAILYTVKYTSGSSTTATHGGTGGTANTLNLDSGEYITKTYACSGLYNNNTRVFYLQLTTNRGRTVQAGKTTSDCTTTVVPTDAGSGGKWGLVGFWGRKGDTLDRAGAIWGAAY